jgi:hypothetical protein
MKKIMIALTIFLAPALVQAATKVQSFTWSYDVAEEANITGFEILNKDNVVVVPSIPKTSRIASVTITYTNQDPQPFYIRAVDTVTGEKSDPSNIATFVPPRKIVKTPGGFWN